MIAHAIGIGAGLLLLVAGIVRLLMLPVECSGRQMEPGQMCTETNKGRLVTRTFDQQQALRDATNGFLIIGGLAATAGSTVLLRRMPRT